MAPCWTCEQLVLAPNGALMDGMNNLCCGCAARYLMRAYVCRWGRIAGLSTVLQISYALVQATVGVGTVIIVYVILITYEM